MNLLNVEVLQPSMGEFIANVLAIWWVLPAALGIAIAANTLAVEGAVMFAPAFLLLFPKLSGAFHGQSVSCD
ncbi:MAG: hypothetical protein J4N94_01965, partial [Chloroflexi bacterium]|nr:hypothetical protein [Chloroflexota bacterium]